MLSFLTNYRVLLEADKKATRQPNQRERGRILGLAACLHTVKGSFFYSATLDGTLSRWRRLRLPNTHACLV